VDGYGPRPTPRGVLSFSSPSLRAGRACRDAAPAQNSALAAAGAELRLANGVSLLGKLDGEFAQHSSTYAGTGTVRYTW